MAHEPLSDPTRRMRRALLGTSVGLILVECFGFRINDISFAGIDATVVQGTLPWFLGASVVWFALNYLAYLRDDLWAVTARSETRLWDATDALLMNVEAVLREKRIWSETDIREVLKSIRQELEGLKLDDFGPAIKGIRKIFFTRTIDHADKQNAREFRILDQNIQERIADFENTLISMSRSIATRKWWGWPGWRIHVVDTIAPFSIAAVGLASLACGEMLRDPEAAQADEASAQSICEALESAFDEQTTIPPIDARLRCLARRSAILTIEVNGASEGNKGNN